MKKKINRSNFHKAWNAVFSIIFFVALGYLYFIAYDFHVIIVASVAFTALAIPLLREGFHFLTLMEEIAGIGLDSAYFFVEVLPKKIKSFLNKKN